MDFLFDFIHQTQTFNSSIEKSDSFAGSQRDFFYAPVRAIPFHQILKKLQIDFSNYTFIDLGSGKGKALILASEYKFKKIIGVEKSKDLYRTSLENLAMRKHQNIEIINDDFLNFHFYGEKNIVFLYDPCNLNDIEKIFTTIFDNCKDSYILYHNNLLNIDTVRSLLPKLTPVKMLQSWGNIYYFIELPKKHF